MKLKKNSWIYRLYQWLRTEAKWFTPGLGIKRWIGLMILGTLFLAMGLVVLILDFYRSVSDAWYLPVISFLSLQMLPRWLRALIYGLLGTGILATAVIGLSKSVLKPFVPPGEEVVTAVTNYRRKQRGPHVVVLGGGSGLATILRGLKKHSANITAIVAMTDDGGSSGELRRRVGVLPPGDVRNCLTALSNDEAMLTQIFQYRFSSEYQLNGHSLGNLFITAMSEITGSFEDAVAEAGQVLAITGHVLPATLHNVNLAASKVDDELGYETIVRGESVIPKTKGRIKRVWLEPDKPKAFPPAIQAILSADLIVVGPGSLYTSILANLMVPEISQAVLASNALKFYVCNVATQPGETDHYSIADHVHAIETHLGQKIFNLILCNHNYSGDLPEGLDWVAVDDDPLSGYQLYFSDLVREHDPTRHDSDQLAATVMDLFYERTGPLLVKED